MTSEVELDLASIRDEDLLRRMWQQTEDFGRKKEIRAHMYKLRETRLKDFYTKGDMDSTSGIGLTKTPLTPSHGESLIDQSFQSFKSKEIRDSESPTHDLKFKTRPSGVIVPDTSGWNVATSSEVSRDGKAYRTETLATTEGVKKLAGGHSKFAGTNEQVTQESHEGDDRNYVKKAGESSKTHLHESSVVGDEKSGRMETKSETVVSSSSHKTTSKFSSSGDDFEPIVVDKPLRILQEFDQLADSNLRKLSKTSLQEQQQHQTNVESRSNILKEERRHHREEQRHHHHEEEQRRHHHEEEQRRHHHEEEQRHHHHEKEQRHHQQVRNEKYAVEDFTNQDRVRSNQINTTSTGRIETREQSPRVTKVYLEEEVNKLAALPGTLISRKIDYPDANTKMITETKELADGTIVTTKRYETKSSKSKTFESDTRKEQISDHSQSRYSKEREIQDKATKRSHDTDHRSSQFTNEADRRSSEIRREDIHRQNQQKQVTRNESFQKHETQSVHDVKRRESDMQSQKIRDEVDRAVTDDYEMNRRFGNLKDQVENIALDSTHKTVKKDLSQTMRNEKITNQDFIETEKGCYMFDRSSRRPEQSPTSDQYYPRRDREYVETETTKTVRRESDFSTHGFPSVGPEKLQEKQPRKPSDDFTTHGFPSVGPQKSGDKYSHRLKEDYTTQGYPSCKVDSAKQVNKNYETRHSDQSYSTHQETVESRINKTHQTSSQQKQKQTSDFTTNGFPSVKPQKYVREPDSRPRQSPETHGYPSTRGKSSSEERYTTRHTDHQEYNIDVQHLKKKDSKDQDHSEYRYHSRSDNFRSPTRSPTKENVINKQKEYSEHRQTEFETYGYPSTKPKSKPDDFVPRYAVDLEDNRKFTSVADDTSSVTTEQTEQTSRTYSNDHTASSRITVEVDAAHDAFARSLRCVSPVDQQRPASSKSIRTSSGSVRSSISPDKRSHRSPSRESGTYSESSKISSSTVTRSRGIDSDKKIGKRITPVKPSDSGRTTKKTIESRRSNEIDNLNESNFNRYDTTTTRSFRKTSQEKHATTDCSVSGSPQYSSTEHPATVPPKQKPTKLPEPIYDVPKSNKKISPEKISKLPEKIKRPIDTDYATVKKPTPKPKDDTKSNVINENKKRVSEDEGFDAESPRSDSPTCSVSDIEYHHTTERSGHQVTDLDEADITVEVNLKNIGRDVNLVTTISDDDHRQYNVNHDFITKEKENTEITIQREHEHNQKTLDTSEMKIPSQKLRHESNGHYEKPSTNKGVFYPQDDNKPKKTEPFYLKKEPESDDGPKKPEDIKKPRQKPVLTRSETYEERCRKILGMDKQTELVEKEISEIRRKSTDGFIITEKINEENIKRSTPSPRAVSLMKPDKKQHVEEIFSNSTITEQKIILETDDQKITESFQIPNRSPSLSPTRRSKAPTRETSPNKRPDQLIDSERSNYFKKTTTSSRSQSSAASSPSRSPYSSPSRKSTPRDTPNETPQTRSPALSPTRKSTSTFKTVEQASLKYNQRSKSPNESQVSRTDSTKKVYGKDKNLNVCTVKKEKSPLKDKSPERQNHVSTAKIQLSPTIGRKPSIPDSDKLPKSPKSPELRSKTRPTTVISTRDEKIDKDTTVQQNYTKQPIDKPSPGKTTTRLSSQKVDTPHTKIPSEKKPINRFERSKTETDKTSIQKAIKSTATINSKKPIIKKPLSVTERKDSAPVHKTTKTEIDIVNQKMLRSTSENIIKTNSRTKPEIEVSSTPKSPRKNSSDKPRKNSSDRRPSKCLSTKTINLTTTTTTASTLINSEDMENVIIDIQQAKSSREPSPNKIIPTPVRPDEDTGEMPRYPDKVQEPDDQPRKSKIKHIPIFEEASKGYISCQITEVEDVEDTVKETATRSTNVNEHLDEVDECLLSVHDKVSKFISTAEEVKKPKTSTPFQREEPTKDDLSETDVCYLSVTDKVTKFLSTAENVAKPTSSSKQIKRPNIDDLDDDLKKDECVLSVSEKVNKFANTVEKLAEPYQQKSAELVAKIDRQVSRTQPSPNERRISPETDKIPKDVKSEKHIVQKPLSPTEKLPLPKPSALKSTEVVQKAKSVFERGNVFTSTPKQRDILSRPSVWEGRKKASPDVKLQDIGVYRKDEETTKVVNEETRSERSPEKEKPADVCKPKQKSPSTTTTNKKQQPVVSNSVSLKKNIFESKISTSKNDTKPSKVTEIKTKSNDRRKEFSPATKVKPVENSKLRSEKVISQRQIEVDEEISSSVVNESQDIEVCENHFISSEIIRNEDYAQGDSVIRKSVIEQERVTSKPTERTTPAKRFESPSRGALKDLSSPKTPKTRTPLPQQISDKNREPKTNRDRSTQSSISAKRSLFEKSDDAPTRTNETRPSYMDHTVSSLEHRRDSTEITKISSRRSSTSKEYDANENRLREGNVRSTEKFGVELRRTNSKDNAVVRRKSSCPEIPHVEEIFDLELLEQMLNTVVGYEQRRRIRTQIRLVKKMMETENKKGNQTLRTVVVKKTEYKTSSRASSKSPERYHSPTRDEIGDYTQIQSKEIVTEEEEEQCIHSEQRSVSPVAKVKTITTTTIKETQKIGDKPATKKITTTTEVTDDKPIWATRNILKKASDNNRVTKPTSTVSKSTAVASKMRTQQKQQQKISMNEEDCITSSYGIGPTDEDGRPLFGIRALKKKSTPGESTKVTGKIITEKYYSENGAEPIGERSVTVYSTNPDDIDGLEGQIECKENETVNKTSKGGVTTITKTRKVGRHQALEETELPAIMDVAKITTSTRTTSTPKIVRKGSVKEISEKFIRKESSSSIAEKINTGSSSSYPKAGLILRAQTHPNKNYEDDDYDDQNEECDIEIKTTRKHSKTILTESDSETESIKIRKSKMNQSSSTRSFLNSSGSKVTGVEDVLTRMRNADNVVEDGDSPEDQEARALLNKFLGASVLMSGMESMVPKDVKMSGTGENPNLRKQEVKTTSITKTIRKAGDSSSPVTRKTCDIEEIIDENLLNKLLEQSTSVEERRKIRARLRHLMAEREENGETKTEIKTETKETQKEEDGAVVKTSTTKVTTRTVSAAAAPKTISPFAKFRQLDKQNSVQSQRTFK